jgi:CRISPR-associated protein Cas1
MLPRVGDSLSFLYIDIARIVQDDTGVDAVIDTPDGQRRIPLPTAALSTLLLGPGTSITARALTTLTRHRTTVICTGAGAIRCYNSAVPDEQPSRWLETQARTWSDPATRTEVARRMYRQRFGETAPPDATVGQLRGFEGARMRAMYRLLARQHGVRPFKRSYDPDDWDSQDPVNKALSAANTCLYGITHAAITAIGCTPGLGFVHTGTSHSFVYDIADLYKARLTIPLAFSLHASTDAEGDARRSFREDLRLFRLLPRIVSDIQNLLEPGSGPGDDDVEEATEELTHLWDPELGRISGGVNYGERD